MLKRGGYVPVAVAVVTAHSLEEASIEKLAGAQPGEAELRQAPEAIGFLRSDQEGSLLAQAHLGNTLIPACKVLLLAIRCSLVA